MSLSNRVSSLVAFMRARYPSGAPAVGYAPLLALLPRRVSEEEIAVIVHKLRALKRKTIDRTDVGVEISHLTDEMPLTDDIDRVHSRYVPFE
ncbi:hypothetical protein A5647_07740 [Mycobacterium sp. 1100029.7]|nr:hypothetical protein A5647_07740 [Mycobacterium sp. 1100029.7]